MEPTEVFITIAIIAAPFAVVAIVALLKGYHLWIHMYRGDRKKDRRHHG
jgi:hypothetical protein